MASSHGDEAEVEASARCKRATSNWAAPPLLQPEASGQRKRARSDQVPAVALPSLHDLPTAKKFYLQLNKELSEKLNHLPQTPAKKAPVLRLDARGREVDEHGNAVTVSKPTNLATLKVNMNRQNKDFLAKSCAHFDARLGIDQNKLLRPKRPGFQFIDERKLTKRADFQRVNNQFGQAQAKEQKHKEEIPDIEPWDSEILLSATYEDISISMEKLNMNMITMYVQHPEPLEPPSEPAPPQPRPLKLTKKEQKKLRTQRRIAKEKDTQEMIRQGLLQPPMPKVKMSNLMKVLGAGATQDPTRLEMEIRMAAAEREQAHADRNTARKLTPSERREKKQRKLFDDPNSLDHTTTVCVYRIRDLSHWQARFKVEANAQENRLTGAAVITDSISVVVVEGGNKSIRRYHKLMMNRMDWASAAVGGDEDVDANEEPDKPANSCALVWQGSVVKPTFTRFDVHHCRSEAAAKKVFVDVDVPHYWDLAVNFA